MKKYTVLRVFGILLLIVGIPFVAIGLFDFFSAFRTMDGPPELFWMAIVGLPATGIGLSFLLFTSTRMQSLRRMQEQMLRAAMNPTFCPNCNQLLQPGSRFCPSCGTKLEP